MTRARARRRVPRSLVALACLALSSLACADVFRPAYLEIRELGGDRYDVLLEGARRRATTRASRSTCVFPEGSWKSSRARAVPRATRTWSAGASSGRAGLVGTSIEIVGPRRRRDGRARARRAPRRHVAGREPAARPRVVRGRAVARTRGDGASPTSCSASSTFSAASIICCSCCRCC